MLQPLLLPAGHLLLPLLLLYRTGRPVDVEQLPDGSLLVSDDEQGMLYRIAPTTNTRALATQEKGPAAVAATPVELTQGVTGSQRPVGSSAAGQRLSWWELVFAVVMAAIVACLAL